MTICKHRFHKALELQPTPFEVLYESGIEKIGGPFNGCFSVGYLRWAVLIETSGRCSWIFRKSAPSESLARRSRSRRSAACIVASRLTLCRRKPPDRPVATFCAVFNSHCCDSLAGSFLPVHPAARCNRTQRL